MRFGRLDLNLLVALDALLDEKSVSMAADRLCLSQSATSSALGRLRDYFGDDLLVVKGRAMVLTPRAEELIDPVRAVLEQIRSTVAVAPPFDPATCDRQIRMMASDYSTQALLAEAFALFEKEAPAMRFEVQPMGDNPIESIERGHIDLLLTIDVAIAADHPSQILFEDDYVVVGWAENPALRGPISREAYFALGHVTARFGRARVPAFDDWFVRRQKQQRRIEVVAPSFLSLPGLVVGTRRIATMHRRMAEMVVRNMPLVAREVPFDIPPIREAVQWNIANTNDKALRWVVDRLAAVARAGAGDRLESDDDPDRQSLEVEYRMNHPQR
ncbi:MAG: LysR family transcriptional regulator [Sphingomonadales bacterium]|nr:LysR family transcriptional regulator [Sphingomonadales bacterium]